MSTTSRPVEVLAGDTLEAIARRAYGDESQAFRILEANPGLSSTLIAGTTINVPADPALAARRPSNQPSAGPDEVALLVGSEAERFRFWERLTIRRAIDSVDSLSLSAPYEPDNAQFREVFKPFQFLGAQVAVGGDPLFTGTFLTPSPNLTANRNDVGLSGYSLPGVLSDCTAPASIAGKLEFNGQNLSEIARTLCAPFGLGTVFEANPGEPFSGRSPFERVALKPSRKIMPFLIGLAQQRGLLISSTEAGELLFTREVLDDIPVARIEDGQAPGVSISPAFNATNYFSHITGFEATSIGTPGEQFTVKNTQLNGPIRPLNFDINEAQGGDVQQAVNAKIGRMFANAIAYRIEVPTWRDRFGDIWRPNTIVTALSPRAMITQDYNFLIRSVELYAKADQRTAQLNVVLPGSFSGQIPEVLPWDL